MDLNPSVCVLMSTYNGEKYLREQLESIFSQEDVSVKLVVRDDGSSDETINILSSYPIYKLIKGENIGCEESFLMLIRENINADYYAFADQDDIWFPQKLKESIQNINNFNEKEPCLFCGNQMITDGELNEIRLMITDEKYDIIKKNKELNYFSNRHGCCLVWNKALQAIVVTISDRISFIPSHDVWLTLIARCTGNVILGKNALQYYRIHTSNTGGLSSGTYARLKKGIKLYWIRSFKRNLYAKACIENLNKYYKDTEGWKYVRKVSLYKDNFLDRISVAFSKQIWAGGYWDGAFFAISVLMGKY